MNRKVEQVLISQLKVESGTVFYTLNPNIHNVLPEYTTTPNFQNFSQNQIVWVVFFTKTNPYIK